jgi:RNA-directed DNA polymerase
MDFEKYKSSFEKLASDSGYSEQNIQRCLSYARVLCDNGVPIIYNTSHLSALVGYKKGYLKRAVMYTTHFYRNFEILKKNGRKRKISEPLPSLMEIQIWISFLPYKSNV